VCGGWAATRRRRDRAEPGRRRDAGQAPPQLNLVWKKIDSGNHALDLEWRGKIGAERSDGVARAERCVAAVQGGGARWRAAREGKISSR